MESVVTGVCLMESVVTGVCGDLMGGSLMGHRFVSSGKCDV